MSDELSVAEEGGRAMVVGVEEGYDQLVMNDSSYGTGSVLRGFFFKNRKQVSISSRNLVR